VVSFEGFSDDEVVRLAAAVEAATRHPLAEAVLREAEGRGLSVPPVLDPRTEPGSGVMAVVQGSLVAVGKREWVEKACGDSIQRPGIQTSSLTRSNDDGGDGSLGSASSSEGGSSSASVVWVGVQGRGVVGALELRDELRPDARPAVRRLRDMGIR